MSPPNAALLTGRESIRIPRANWMSLSDAVEHIQEVSDCDRVTARQKLREVIADTLLPVRWIDQENEHDMPPSDRAFWKKATMRSENGGEFLYEVSDVTIVESPGSMLIERKEIFPRYRGLLVDRRALHALWPAPVNSDQRAENDSRGTLPPASKQAIRDKARELYATMRENPPNIAQAEVLIRKSVPGSTRSRIREVLNEKEFSDQRRRTGKRGKRKGSPIS